MKLKANDTLHVSSVKADNIIPGEEFEVSDDLGRQLCERGLAKEVSSSTKKSNDHREEKVEPAPTNKPDVGHDNKTSRKGK